MHIKLGGHQSRAMDGSTSPQQILTITMYCI